MKPINEVMMGGLRRLYGGGRTLSDYGRLLMRDRPEVGWRDLLGERSYWEGLPSELVLPGTSGNYATTPSAPSMGITDDLDLRVLDLTLADWTPAAEQTLLAKRSGLPQRSFHLRISATALDFYCSNDGTNFLSLAQGPLSGVRPSDGVAHPGLRVTRRRSDGRTQFFQLVDGVWVQFGSDVIVSPGIALFSSTASLNVGAGESNGSLMPLNGSVGRVEVRNGIDGPIVASPNFAAQPAGTTEFTDAQGNVWTVNGSASIAAAAD